MKNGLILVVALLVGVLAFWLSAKYMADERAKIYGGAEKVDVIVAKQDLPSMTILSREDLARRKEFKSAVGPDAFTPNDFNKLLGKRLKYPLKRGKMVLWSHVDISRDRQTGLAPIISPKKRAMSISISGAASVSGHVKPGDHVDVLGTFTFPSRLNPQQVESVTLTLMQNVSVLATGQTLTTDSDKWNLRSGYSTVTFELYPEEVEILVFAQQTRGQLYLSLRNPEDAGEKNNLPSVNFDYLESELKTINERRQLNIERDLPESAIPYE